ncbi:MAG: YtxH domain-containing protein [Tannerellaceae bacterium]|jgi:gas vesicle protein|nr:YtxH domain-containing protein [Tannerellaceae bacterium]
MKTGDSKLLVGLLIGAAVGATITYLATTDKKDQLLGELNALADKLKEGYHAAVAKYCEGKRDVKEDIETIVEA